MVFASTIQTKGGMVMVQSFIFEIAQREAACELVCQLLDNELVMVVSRGLVVTVTIKNSDRTPIPVDLERISENKEVELRVENHILTLRPIRYPRVGVNAVWL